MTRPVHDQLRHVIVFAPYIEENGQLVSPHYDLPEYRAEIGGWMGALGLTWEWQPVTTRNLPQILEKAKALSRTSQSLVFNLCDGSDSDGYPGIEVVDGLTANNIPYTGSDPDFYRITTSKAQSKQAMTANGVQTAPYVMIANGEKDLARAIAEIGFPLFIKPDVSAGSYGIQIDSVCYDIDSARRKISQLQQGMHGQHFEKGAIRWCASWALGFATGRACL
jgi:D-alanine-D-alanine ligase-like ATP-grasp enzyme